MSSKTPPINLRLPDGLGDSFEALCKEFPGLPQAVVARILLASILSRPLDDQIQIVITGIRKPGAKPEAKRGGANTVNRIAQ